MLDLYSNRHLVEVNCGFQFPQESVIWDSTFFGQFYDKIKEHGFNEKQERKGVQITFNEAQSKSQGLVTSSTVEDQVIFKNNEKGLAIAMGKNKISFHIINDYTNWDDFINIFITPFFGYYRDLGLGNGIRNCNIVYLNRFVRSTSSFISDYFTIISPIDTKFGLEVNTFVQRIVENESNLLIAKLNTQTNEAGLNINLECGAVCKSLECMNKDWHTQANETHEPIRAFFESLITNQLRKEL